MATIKENLKATVTNRITSKTLDYSIAKTDVGNTFDDTIDLLGAPIINPNLYYPLGWVGIFEGKYYATLQDNVLGDVTNTANWTSLVSGKKGLVSDVTTYTSTVGAITEDYYITQNININQLSGQLLRFVITSTQATITYELAYQIVVSLENAVDGDCVILDMDTIGAGMNLLSILGSGGGTEWLANKSTYLLTYQAQQTTDGKNYTLRKLSETGFTRVLNVTFPLKVGTGKVFINTGEAHNIVVPPAFRLAGQSVEIIIKSGSINAITSSNPADVFVGTPTKKLVSDGVNTWIYV